MEDEGTSSSVIIDIAKLQRFLESKSDDHCALFRASETDSKTPNAIHKVRHPFRDAYKSDYEPVVVSIGPYHRGKGNLRHMEKVKWDCLRYILKANPEKALHDYIQALWKLYPVVRRYYAEDIEMQNNEFLHMLLLDGCYIIGSIWGLEWNTHNPNSMSDNDPDHNCVDSLEQSLVMRDFVLIENQVPFLIVKTIYELFTSKSNTSALLSEKIAVFVEEILQDVPVPIKESERPREFCHLLHLCHIYLRPTVRGCCRAPQQDSDDPQTNQWHQAVDYCFAGIKFKRKDFDRNNPHSLLDVCFHDDVLQIPYFYIDETTATVFRNLIALEQTNLDQCRHHITAYIVFISQLVRDTRDVAMLVGRGIIGHHFDSEEEVSKILTSLGQCVLSDFSGNYYLNNICQNLEAYYNKNRTKWGKIWVRRHADSAVRVWI